MAIIKICSEIKNGNVEMFQSDKNSTKKRDKRQRTPFDLQHSLSFSSPQTKICTNSVKMDVTLNYKQNKTTLTKTRVYSLGTGTKVQRDQTCKE